MRTNFKSIELPKKLAKSIVHVFPALKLSTGQEWAARLCGYRNWHELDLRTRNFTGEPTPDPFFADYVALDQEFGADRDSPSVVAKTVRFDYQTAVLAALTRRLGAVFKWPAETYWKIMQYAHHGVPHKYLQIGSGTPLFDALQVPWFGLEHGARCPCEEGDMVLDDWVVPVGLLNGFSSVQQRDKWLRGASGWTPKQLSELKDEFPGIAPRIGGGSAIRLAADDQGRPVMVQSTRRRYWWRDSRRRMLGGFSVTTRVTARQDDSCGDELQLCVHDAWATLPTEFNTIAVPSSQATDDICRFLETRLGMAVMSGTVTFACDERPGSKRLAETLSDLVCDLCREAVDMDLGEILKPAVVPYQPKYPRRDFCVLKSELV